jgi:hypothetical protein
MEFEINMQDLFTEEKKTTTKNKAHYIPKSQLREFCSNGGPDYAKLCAEALIHQLPQDQRQQAANRYENQTGKKIKVYS